MKMTFKSILKHTVVILSVSALVIPPAFAAGGNEDPQKAKQTKDAKRKRSNPQEENTFSAKHSFDVVQHYPVNDCSYAYYTIKRNHRYTGSTRPTRIEHVDSAIIKKLKEYLVDRGQKDRDAVASVNRFSTLWWEEKRSLRDYFQVRGLEDTEALHFLHNAIQLPLEKQQFLIKYIQDLNPENTGALTLLRNVELSLEQKLFLYDIDKHVSSLQIRIEWNRHPYYEGRPRPTISVDLNKLDTLVNKTKELFGEDPYPHSFTMRGAYDSFPLPLKIFLKEYYHIQQPIETDKEFKERIIREATETCNSVLSYVDSMIPG